MPVIHGRCKFPLQNFKAGVSKRPILFYFRTMCKEQYHHKEPQHLVPSGCYTIDIPFHSLKPGNTKTVHINSMLTPATSNAHILQPSSSFESPIRTEVSTAGCIRRFGFLANRQLLGLALGTESGGVGHDLFCLP